MHFACCHEEQGLLHRELLWDLLIPLLWSSLSLLFLLPLHPCAACKLAASKTAKTTLHIWPGCVFAFIKDNSVFLLKGTKTNRLSDCCLRAVLVDTSCSRVRSTDWRATFSPCHPVLLCFLFYESFCCIVNSFSGILEEHCHTDMLCVYVCVCMPVHLCLCSEHQSNQVPSIFPLIAKDWETFGLIATQ